MLKFRAVYFDATPDIKKFLCECGLFRLTMNNFDLFQLNIKENLKPFNATYNENKLEIIFESEQDYMFFKLRYG